MTTSALKWSKFFCQHLFHVNQPAEGDMAIAFSSYTFHPTIRKYLSTSTQIFKMTLFSYKEMKARVASWLEPEWAPLSSPLWVPCSFHYTWVLKGGRTSPSAFWKCVRMSSVVTVIGQYYWHFNAWRPRTFMPTKVLFFTPHNFQMSYQMWIENLCMYLSLGKNTLFYK